MLRVAINGFGRIGKTFLRTILEDNDAAHHIEVIAINIGTADPKASALAFKFDSLMGTFKQEVVYKNGSLHIGEREIPIIAELDPSKLPWKAYAIDWVVEATGQFTDRVGAQKHRDAGARAVLITAPAKGADITIIPGVNEHDYVPDKQAIISLGSCTTNALATMIKVINDSYQIDFISMSTIHAYTNSQALLDVDPQLKDPRRARAAALNIVPTTTGAMELIGNIIPDIAGKAVGGALRVPVPKVSIVDLLIVVQLKQNEHISNSSINTLYQKAASSTLKNILEFTNNPLVSSDFSGNPHSAIVDGHLTDVIGSYIKVFGWYDNEWGYACRLKDFLLKYSY